MYEDYCYWYCKYHIGHVPALTFTVPVQSTLDELFRPGFIVFLVLVDSSFDMQIQRNLANKTYTSVITTCCWNLMQKTNTVVGRWVKNADVVLHCWAAEVTVVFWNPQQQWKSPTSSLPHLKHCTPSAPLSSVGRPVGPSCLWIDEL